MQEFNLAGELLVTGASADSFLDVEADVTTYYFNESVNLGDLDSSMYELGSADGIYASSGLRSPDMLTQNEEKSVVESIFQGIDQNTFQRINVFTGKFMYLHGQGLLGTLGGILDLIVGVLDLFQITADVIQGIMGFFSGSKALEAGVGNVLGGVFGNGRVKEAITKGAERNNKFAEDTSKRVGEITSREAEITEQGDGHRQAVVSGVDSVKTGKSLTSACTSIICEAPLITNSCDTLMLNCKSEKHVSDYFSMQSQHIDYTVDDSVNMTSNVYSTTSNNKRDVNREYVSNSEASEQIATVEMHIQAGVYGKQSPFTDIANVVPKQNPKLTLSSTKNIYLYAGDNYFMQSKSISAIDSKYFFINTGTAMVASILGRPRQIVEVTPLANPQTVKTEIGLSDSITIAEGNQIPIKSMGTKPTTTYTYDSFTSS